MQERDYVADLVLIEHSIERRHITPAEQNRIVHMLIGRRHSAWQVMLAKDSDQRWSLQRFFLVRVVTDRAVGEKDIVTTLLLRS